MRLFNKGILTIAGVLLSATAVMAAYPTNEPIKSIPLPPSGQRWILNEQLSDEFNDNELDRSKWLNHHATWQNGRAPGLFTSDNIEFFGGCMVLRGEKMKRDTVIDGTTWSIWCAAVSSVEPTVHYGNYYECRLKANQTTLSSTFWFSAPGQVPVEGKQPEGAEPGMFAQELDVYESIGRTGDFEGNYFSEGMHSNMHYRYYAEGAKGMEDIRAEQAILKPSNGSIPSDDFNIYGCWWRDSENATFYLNNDQSLDRHFVGSRNHEAPFDIEFRFTEPMWMHFVVETYPEPWIGLPNDEELADPTLNRTYYDWVRSYQLVDADFVNSGAAPMLMFEDQVYIDSKSRTVNRTSDLDIHYTASVDRQINVVIYDESGVAVAKSIVAAPAGYANISVSSLFAKGLKFKDLYSIVAYLETEGADAADDYLSGDSFVAQMK